MIAVKRLRRSAGARQYAHGSIQKSIESPRAASLSGYPGPVLRPRLRTDPDEGTATPERFFPILRAIRGLHAGYRQAMNRRLNKS
jgi:hypothetical protein